MPFHDDESFALAEELATFTCGSSGPFALPLAAVADDLARAHELLLARGATVGDYLREVILVVEQRAGVTLSLGEAMQLEERVWVLWAERLRFRTAFMRNLAAGVYTLPPLPPPLDERRDRRRQLPPEGGELTWN